jgi:hypothetical protein
MSFFVLIQVALFAGVALAALAAVGIVMLSARREKAPKLEGDCREVSLALHGEVVRNDC